MNGNGALTKARFPGSRCVSHVGNGPDSLAIPTALKHVCRSQRGSYLLCVRKVVLLMMGHRFERVGVDMSYVGPLPPLKVKKETRWYRFVGDSFLVLGSMLLLTEIISFFHLNQRIPDSFLVYLHWSTTSKDRV